MKRVVLLVDECAMSPSAAVLGLRMGNGEIREFVVKAAAVESVEDVRDPLPTTPGETFWGRSELFEPQRWFVTKSSSCRPEDGEIDYVGSQGVRMTGHLAAEVHGLVRVPDPEGAL